MKRYILLFLLIFSSFNLAYSNNFEIFPIVFNLHTVKTLDNNVVAFGNSGYAMLSNDEGENWSQIRVNNSGLIVNIFGTNNTLISFGNKGDICVTNLTDSTTITEKKLDDSILAVIQYPDGYFVRAADRIFTLNNNFEIENEYNLISPGIIGDGARPIYYKSIAYFKEHFILELDSAYFVRYDKQLNPIDTLSVLATGIITVAFNSNLLVADDSYLYFRITTLEKYAKQSYIYRTNNFKDIEIYASLAGSDNKYGIYNDQVYILPRNLDKLKDRSTLSKSIDLDIMDFTIKGDKQIIVGNFKIIRILDLQDSTLRVVSDANGYGTDSAFEPLILPNNEILLFASNNLPYLWKSTDKGVTFKPTIELNGEAGYSVSFDLSQFKTKYYDTAYQKLYFFGAGVNGRDIFETDETCKTLVKNEANLFIRDNRDGEKPRVDINDDYITLSVGPGYDKKTNPDRVYNIFYRLDKELNLQETFIDSSDGSIDYIYSLDTNSFIVHCRSVINGTSEIRYTLDKTETWETIYKYKENETQSFNTEIWSQGKRYLALVHNEINTTNNNERTAVYLDVLDLASKEFHRVKEWYPDEFSKEHEFGVYRIGLVSDDDYVYVSFQDTLYYVSDILDKSSWAYHNLPSENSKIVGPLIKYDDYIIGRYVDENTPFSNILQRNLFRIKPLDSISTSVESEIETMNYLFTYPPYPMPATNEVRSLIYWDMSIDIDEKNIAVYNIYGEKVSTEEQIKIDRLTGYSGNLVWDCSGVPAGVYLINIKHGTQNKTIKAIVTK